MPGNEDQDPCVVCTREQAETLRADFDGVHQLCPRCGEFKISGTALATMGQALGAERRAKISGWIHDQNLSGSVPFITSDNFQNINNRPLPSVAERANGLLIEAARGQVNLQITFNINEPRFMAATYSSSMEDVRFLLSALGNNGLVENLTMDGDATISAQGLYLLDELKKENAASSQGFVAMWFNEDLSLAYADGFQRGVLSAGYDPIRIDRVEHINRIDDEIIVQIRNSLFVVADFTGHRGGVYFEAGYAMGLNKPIFWTCRDDDMDELHFDIRQFNCIDWHSPDDLARRLSTRINAVLGPGPNVQEG